MSTLNVANISDGTDTVETGYVVNGSAKASFRYTQSTNTVRSSKNVSSIVDASTGVFTVNYTSAFLSEGTQRPTGIIEGGTGRVITADFGGTSSAKSFRTTNNSASGLNDDGSSGVVMGDLA